MAPSFPRFCFQERGLLFPGCHCSSDVLLRSDFFCLFVCFSRLIVILDHRFSPFYGWVENLPLYSAHPPGRFSTPPFFFSPLSFLTPPSLLILGMMPAFSFFSVPSSVFSVPFSVGAPDSSPGFCLAAGQHRFCVACSSWGSPDVRIKSWRLFWPTLGPHAITSHFFRVPILGGSQEPCLRFLSGLGAVSIARIRRALVPTFPFSNALFP